jgi:uncharacterized phiE125 gp8 family phage protein
MQWTVTTPPAAPPVSWAEAYRHLRLDSAHEDRTYVEQLLAAATDYAEARTSCAFMPRTITATFYTGDPLELPRGPMSAVDSVTADGQTVAGWRMEYAGTTGRIIPTGPGESRRPLVVVYRAGYATAAAVPAMIRHAVLMHAATLYENRESVGQADAKPLPHALDDFYRLAARSVAMG